jgi:HK97 family phage portal protein
MARKAVESMELEEEYRINLLQNDARVSGILSSEKEISEEAAKRLAAQWNLAHGGPNKAGGTAVLEGGMKWQQLSLSTEDMQFIEQRNYSVAEIARLFGVPPSKINAESSGSLTYSTVESENQAFVRDCLLTYLRRIEQALDSDNDLVPAGQCPEFNVDGLLRADAKTRAERAEILIRAGVMDPEEARKDEGLAPRPKPVESAEAPEPAEDPEDTPVDAPSPDMTGGTP